MSNYNTSDDIDDSIGLGFVNGVRNAATYGVEAELPASTLLTLGTGQEEPTLPPDTGTTVELVSDNEADTEAIMTVEVLDVDFKLRTITGVGLEGTTPVVLTDPDTGEPLVVTRINSMVNVGPRGQGELLGSVQIRDEVTPSEVYAATRAGGQDAKQAVLTVPAGERWAIKTLIGTMQKSGGADTDAVVSVYTGGVGRVVRAVFGFGLQRSGDTSVDLTSEAPSYFAGPTDIFLKGEASTTGTTIAAYATFRMFKT